MTASLIKASLIEQDCLIMGSETATAPVPAGQACENLTMGADESHLDWNEVSQSRSLYPSGSTL